MMRVSVIPVMHALVPSYLQCTLMILLCVTRLVLDHFSRLIPQIELLPKFPCLIQNCTAKLFPNVLFQCYKEINKYKVTSVFLFGISHTYFYEVQSYLLFLFGISHTYFCNFYPLRLVLSLFFLICKSLLSFTKL
jgi:hypothetical protein